MTKIIMKLILEPWHYITRQPEDVWIVSNYLWNLLRISGKIKDSLLIEKSRRYMMVLMIRVKLNDYIVWEILRNGPPNVKILF